MPFGEIPDTAIAIGDSWHIMYTIEVPCRKVDPEDWDTCAIVGHGPGHFDTIICSCSACARAASAVSGSRLRVAPTAPQATSSG